MPHWLGLLTYEFEGAITQSRPLPRLSDLLFKARQTLFLAWGPEGASREEQQGTRSVQDSLIPRGT